MKDSEIAISKLKECYDEIVSGTREPITLFLQKPENGEKLARLVICLNYFVKAIDAEELGASMDRTLVVLEAILQDLHRRYANNDKSVTPAAQEDLFRWHHPQKNYYSGSGKIACPVCKTGSVAYRRSAYNGHVKAGCETKGCVAWTE